MAWAPASGRLLGPGSHGPPVSRSTVRPPRPDRWPHYGKPGADLLRLSRLEKGCPSWRPTGPAADPYGLAIPAGPSSAAAAGRRRSKRASSQAPTAARAVTRSATSSVEGRGASAFRYAVSKRSEEPATAAGSPDRCRSASIALPAYGLSIMLSIVAATARHPHRENRLRPNACRSASHPAMSESSSDWSSRHAPQRRNIARAGWVIWGQLLLKRIRRQRGKCRDNLGVQGDRPVAVHRGGFAGQPLRVLLQHRCPGEHLRAFRPRPRPRERETDVSSARPLNLRPGRVAHADLAARSVHHRADPLLVVDGPGGTAPHHLVATLTLPPASALGCRLLAGSLGYAATLAGPTSRPPWPRSGRRRRGRASPSAHWPPASRRCAHRLGVDGLHGGGSALVGERPAASRTWAG